MKKFRTWTFWKNWINRFHVEVGLTFVNNSINTFFVSLYFFALYIYIFFNKFQNFWLYINMDTFLGFSVFCEFNNYLLSFPKCFSIEKVNYFIQKKKKKIFHLCIIFQYIHSKNVFCKILSLNVIQKGGIKFQVLHLRSTIYCRTNLQCFLFLLKH